MHHVSSVQVSGTVKREDWEGQKECEGWGAITRGVRGLSYCWGPGGGEGEP